ncbi:MAG: hypothetical protein ACI9UV_000698 [Algoriphagus sp.]|jgi:hypothetical protein
MKNPFYIGIVIFLSVGCSEETSSKLLIGNWWSVQSDSTYYELYINEDELSFNHESVGPIPYRYNFEGDSLIITAAYDKTIQRKWGFSRKTDSTFILTDANEKIQLNRLNFNFSYFDALEDSLLYEKFEQEFFNRYMIRK